MSKSQPVKTISTTNGESEDTNQNEHSLKDFINDWKKKTRTDSQYDRIKRMLFSINHKPTDFKASDFFPPIPDTDLASDNEENNIETIQKARKSLSKRKLDYDSCQNSDQTKSIDSSILQDGEKQRRQPLSSINELTNLKSVSPIMSPTKTTRNVLKLKRASLLQQIQKDDKLNNLENNTDYINDINQIDQEINKENNISKNKYNTRLSSTINNLESPLIQSKKTPARQAFDDSIRRKSTNLSLMTNNVDVMNEGPLSENDQILVASTELFKSHDQTNNKDSKSQSKLDQNKNDSEDEDDLDVFKPPTPPPPVKPVNKSSITITKRVSNEPVKEIQIDLSSMSTKPKINTRSSSTSKSNDSLNNTQTELISFQSNNFLRRSSFGNNRTVNSTVNSSASVLFKPVKKSNFKQLPTPPLFNQANKKDDTDHSCDDTDRSQDNVKKKKPKKLTKTKEPKKDSKVDKASKNESIKSLRNEEQNNEPASEQVVETPQEEVEPVVTEEVEHIPEDNSIKTRAQNRSKITSFFTSSKNVNDEVQREETNKDKSKSKKNKTKTSKTTKSKRKPLKDIENQIKTKSQNEGFFANNKTVLIDKNNQNLDENQDNDSNAPVALRRSKRAKLDKHSQPVYGYETIKDYKGNTCIVRTLIGTKEKIDVKIGQELMKLNHLVPLKTNNSKKDKKSTNRESKKQTPIKNSQKNNKKKTNKINNNNTNNDIENNNHIDSHENISNNNEVSYDNNELIHNISNNNNNINNNSSDNNNNNNNEVNFEHEPILNSKENSLSITALNQTNCMENSQVNKSNETAYLIKDNITQESEALHLYFFHKHLDKKEYQLCSTGVGISPLSDLDGLIRIENNHSTRTSIHDEPITYFVQRGTCIFSINGTISIHNEKDVIHVPSKMLYKIKNCSRNDQEIAYLYFRFEKK